LICGERCVYSAYTSIPDSITNETLAAQTELLADCAATLLPDGSLTVVCYPCTSGSLVIGEERVFAELQRGAPDYIAEFALVRDRPDADAIFVSCGALRSLGVIGEFEARAGKPAICSNQTMIWDCLRRAGIADRFGGYGRLLAEC
jgi:maleate cis-trans isomerase